MNIIISTVSSLSVTLRSMAPICICRECMVLVVYVAFQVYKFGNLHHWSEVCLFWLVLASIGALWKYPRLQKKWSIFIFTITSEILCMFATNSHRIPESCARKKLLHARCCSWWRAMCVKALKATCVLLRNAKRVMRSAEIWPRGGTAETAYRRRVEEC